MSSKHVKWVEFLQDYTFVLKHRAEIDNNAVDAFSCLITVLQSMQNPVIAFERLKDEYPQCPNFGIIYKESLDNPSPTQGDFLIRERYLFKGAKLCIPRTSLRDFLTWELHAGDLIGHISRDKTIVLVENRFYWPSLKRDVATMSPSITLIN